MEENSDVHMETDVSSTTDDAVDTQEVTGSNGQVEMTITVEKVNEEEATSYMENNSQVEIDNNVSSRPTTGKDSPQKEQQSQGVALKSPNKSIEVLKSIQKSPAKTESPQMVNIISPVKTTIHISNTDQTAESVDSSTKITVSSHDIVKKKSQEKSSHSELEQDIQSSSAVHNTKSNPEKRFVNISELQKVQSSFNILKSPSNENLVEKSTAKETVEQKRSFQIKRSIKSPPVKLVRKQHVKEYKLKDTTITEFKPLQTPLKETKLYDTMVKENKLHERTMKEIISQDSIKPLTSKDQLSSETGNESEKITSPNQSHIELISMPESQPASARADISIDGLEVETSNDSQLSLTPSEKEHNKSISRELKSLINSAKESKIINECTQLTSKTRKSRTNLDVSATPVEAEIIQGDKQDSPASESDKLPLKRSMRSQNPEFVTKCKQFLNSVTSKVMKDSDETQSDSEPEEFKQKQKLENQIEKTDNAESSPKRKKIVATEVEEVNNGKKLRSDPYCWRCHWQLEAEPNEKQPMYSPMHCTVCVRSYHYRCMTVVERKVCPEKNWVCPDCLQILYAESSDTRSPAMKKISLGMLCDLLKFALERMEALNGVDPFLHPVDRSEFPDYDKIVVHPMDLSQMQQNITAGQYGSTEAFIADAQWILHNSILFNACEQTFTHSKLTLAARALVRTCRAEMVEIETCPECYAGAHSRNLTYFTDVCSTPHMILWAKLKGFPYWPAKAVAVNNGMVDVRFFGQHDKSWVPVRDCYLYSEKDPNTTKNKKQELMQCRQEAEVHIRNICRKYGTFVYAPFKTAFDYTKMTEQLKLMIPSFEGEIKSVNDNKASPVGKEKRRSTSKSSKSSINDGDISECDEFSMKSSTSSNKNVDEADTGTRKEEVKDIQKPDTSTTEKNKSMDVDTYHQEVTETPSRKRRRSTFPESVPLVESTSQKKKKVDKKPEETKPDPGPSNKDDKNESIKNNNTTEVEEVIKKAEKTPETVKNTDVVPEEEDIHISLEEKEGLRVTPIKLVALPRVNKQTPKIFTTAKVTKSTPSTSTPTTPSTPLDEDKSLNSSSSKRSKVTKADKLISEQKELKGRSSRRNSRNKSRTSTPKLEKEKRDKSSSRSSDKKSDKSANVSTDKKSDGGSDASTSRDKPSKRKEESERSLLKKSHDIPKPIKDEKGPTKKSEDDLSLSVIARDNRNLGLPTISNVVSLYTTAEKSNTTSTKPITVNTKSPNTKAASSTKTTTPSSKTTAPKTIEITVEANPDSSIFTPTSTSNVGNMKEAVSKLNKLRNETTSEPFVGRLGVKAFARMTSPDVNDDVQVEVKSEEIDLDEIDEERQMEKMDLMNACKLQPVNQNNSLRDVRVNKVVVTPLIVKKPSTKAPEPRPRAKKTFPQPKRPESGSELNGKNSMVYIPIQPPNTQQPVKSTKSVTTQQAIATPLCVTAGPRSVVPVVSTNVVNTVTTPLRPITSTLSSPQPLGAPSTTTVCNVSPITLGQVSTVNHMSNFGQVSNINQMSNIGQVPTVGPTTVHTVPLMTSVNGQWMFSLQPVMSVGSIDNTPTSPMVNGITDRTNNSIVPVSSSTVTPNASVIPPITAINRSIQNMNASPGTNDNGTPEMPRLLQRPLLNPFDANTPIGSLPAPSTAGPLTAKLNQNAVKLTDFFRTLLEDSIDKLDEPLAQVTALKLQLEQARWRNQQNLDELKHNHELTLSEMRQSFEKDKQRIMSEARRAAQVELEAAVKLTKTKQWCANCHQEAQFYCCWNTSYCDYSCQRAHWNSHFNHCTQEQSFPSCSLKDIPGSSHLDPLLQEQQTLQTPQVKITDHLEQRLREQQPSTSRPWEQQQTSQTPTQFKITDHLEQRLREQQPSTSRSWEQQQPSTSRSWEQTLILQPPPQYKITDHLEQRLREQQPSTSRPWDQQVANSSDKDAPESRLHQGDNPPKSVPPQTPALTTIGGKPAPIRVFTDPSGTQKTSIIVSMIEDPNGNQTLKCLGTYKAPASATTQSSPLLINKQTNDDGSKKTVTSGGYLIVGASGNTTSVITPASARRPPVQYFS